MLEIKATFEIDLDTPIIKSREKKSYESMLINSVRCFYMMSVCILSIVKPITHKFVESGT